MPRNIEIKASVENIERVEELAAKLSESKGTLIEQQDTFFKVPNGRLKLRELKGSPAQLIFYLRGDTSGPKCSNFDFADVSDPAGLKMVLGKALGVKGVVSKKRILYLVGQTRIHVDRVDNLGNFMELEVRIDDGQPESEGESIAKDLMTKLEVKEENLISCAYMDLILNAEKSS